jgi:hypothetical protein
MGPVQRAFEDGPATEGWILKRLNRTEVFVLRNQCVVEVPNSQRILSCLDSSLGRVPACDAFRSIPFYSIPSIPFPSILFYSILFYSILFYSILFYSLLLYSILFYSILFYSILFYSILFYSILFYSILFHPVKQNINHIKTMATWILRSDSSYFVGINQTLFSLTFLDISAKLSINLRRTHSH